MKHPLLEEFEVAARSLRAWIMMAPMVDAEAEAIKVITGDCDSNFRRDSYLAAWGF